ncbi:phosphate acyltransferase [Chloropicon primus]|uniref:Phosphate acyltransferase n=1 Tax=Chloropicon primus TaxID=1764295 RepID=A0A5B8MUQ2_9CHLO|nr:phosphate acyltransferase [Chloropicon primus]UPR03253.1 phosphate acyltransferase [Chloropicon primus]|mmetsp:Transcript_2598/g.7150  ORF Transcript_2598/g.7150 Transcript_2598/m.7150 type:complete len:575 (-) Transcript_2598:2864-4588(-)|eukprot:QDZ24041.1 phosphate acyltransferase [Chloropicon primus]
MAQGSRGKETVVTFDVGEESGSPAFASSTSGMTLSSRSDGLTPKEKLAAANVAQSRANPFVNNTPPWSRKIVIQTVLVSIFVLPLRLLLFCPSIVMAWILDAIANIGHYVHDEPMPQWRCRIVNWSSYFWRAWLFSLSFQEINVVGTPAPRSEAPICVVNHVSFIDIFIMYACKRFMFVAKKEVTKIPFGRDIIRAGQTILVDRTSKKSSESAKEAICARARQTSSESAPGAPEWPTIVMFPESTCTNGTALITFKQGAFIAGVPVQPITLKYHWKTADPCKVYGGGPGIGIILLRMLTSWHNSVDVHFMDVYQPDEEEKRDALLYSEHVRVLMARDLRIPVTNHSYADVQLLLAAQKMNIRGNSRKKLNLEMNTLTDILDANCSVEEFKFFVNEFHKAAGKDGELTQDQLFEVLGMERNPVTERVFQLIDINSDGTLQFKEFMSGVALLYFSKDPEMHKQTLAEIVSRGQSSETGRLYFDEADLMCVANMKSFAFSRKKKFPVSKMKSMMDMSEDHPSVLSTVSLATEASDTEASPSSPPPQLWWTPDELYQYIKRNPKDFAWLQNPSLIKKK